MVKQIGRFYCEFSPRIDDYEDSIESELVINDKVSFVEPIIGENYIMYLEDFNKITETQLIDFMQQEAKRLMTRYQTIQRTLYPIG